MTRCMLCAYFLLSGCATIAPQKPVIAPQLRQTIPRVCGVEIVATDHLSPPEFVSAIQGAIKRANDLVGAVVYLWSGKATYASSMTPRGMVYVREARTSELDRWPELVDGKIKWQADKKTGCLTGALILVRPSNRTDDSAYLKNVIFHELLHSLGLGHIGDPGYVMSHRLDSRVYTEILPVSKASLRVIADTYAGTKPR